MGKLIEDGYDEGDDAKQKLWAYADRVLPREIYYFLSRLCRLISDFTGKTVWTATPIQRREDGMPLFPLFNCKTKTYAEVAHILNDYFLVVWGKCGTLTVDFWTYIPT